MKEAKTVRKLRSELKKDLSNEKDWTKRRILSGQIDVLNWMLDGKVIK